MKYCPKCNRYYSVSQSSCADDGSELALKDLYGLAGRVVAGKYRIDSLVGVGGMSAVYSAHQIGIERRVAFKILLPHLAASNEQIVVLFEREARTAGQISHENIATIYDAGQTEDELAYIAMEFLSGQTLEDEIIRAAPFPLERTAYLLRQIAAALEAAHGRNIIHRDLKPSNIMLVARADGSEQVKVLDFGLAKLLGSSLDLQVSSAVGTPHYASPEQFQVGAEIDPRTDVYSLGVMLYYMLTKRLPFHADTIPDLIKLHLLEVPVLLRELRPEAPQALEELLQRMLAKNPHFRPRSAGEAAELFEQAIGLPVRRRNTSELRVSNSGRQAPTNGFSKSGAGNSGSSHARETVSKPPSGSTPAKITQPLPAQAPVVQTVPQTGVRTPVAEAPVRGTNPLPALPQPRPRNKKGLWIVVTLLLFVVALLFHYKLLLPERMLEKPEPEIVVLAKLVNETGDLTLDSPLEQVLFTQLSQNPKIQLATSENIKRILQTMTRSPQEPLTREIAREVAQRLRLRAFLVSNISKLDRNYSLTLEAVNSGSGETITRSLAEVENKDLLIGGIRRTAEELGNQLTRSLAQLPPPELGLEEATTSSFDALRAYSLGRAQNTKDSYLDALSLYQRALELDPQFSLAHYEMARTYANLGQYELATQSAAKAYELRERNSDRDKRTVLSYYELSVSGDLEHAIELCRVLIQTRPESMSPRTNIILCFNQLGQPAPALAQAEEMLRRTPDHSIAAYLYAEALLRHNRLDEAQEVINKAFGFQLDRYGYHETLYRIGYLRNDRALMEKQVAWAKGRTDEFRALDWQAQTAALAGRLAESAALSQQGVELARQYNLAEPAATLALNAALRQALLGHTAAARQWLAQAESLAPGSLTTYAHNRPMPFGPLVMALCGEFDKARAASALMAKKYPKSVPVNELWLQLARATIALEQNQAAAALETASSAGQYEMATSFYYSWLRGQIFLKLRRGPEAVAEFEKILKHQYWDATSLFHPLARLGLARATAVSGDVTQSRRHYEDFLKEWQGSGADQNLPLLALARKEYEALR